MNQIKTISIQDMSMQNPFQNLLKCPSLALLSLILLLLSGCQTIDSTNNWPANIPDRQLFVDDYNESIDAGEKVIKLEPHLTWIKRFYQGTVLYPQGWIKVSDLVLASLNSKKDVDNVAPRLAQLGFDISSEWAKANSIRKINSANIIVWANGLRTAANEGNQLDFLGKVEQDVAALIQGELDASDIIRSRYFPPEDFDDF